MTPLLFIQKISS